MIPRTVHHIWVGPDPLPKELNPYIKSWRKHHPEWEHRMWTEDNLPQDPVREEVLETLRSPVERSDILRLELLSRYGGIYVDTDLECLRPLDDVLGEADFVGTYFKPGRVTNTFIASAPGHPLLVRALRELKPRKFHGFDKDVAGPPFLNRLVKGYPDVKLLEPPLLFPQTESERSSALAIHHMSRTWKDSDGLRQSMLRAEERLQATKKKLDQERRRHAATQKKLKKAEERLNKASRGARGKSAEPESQPSGKSGLRERLGLARRS